MHLSVQRNVLDYFAAVCLERGSEVVDADSAHRRHHPVSAAGGNAPQQEIVCALTPPSTHYVIAFFELGQKARDLVWIVVQISVHGQHELSLRMLTAGRQRRGQPEVPPQLNDQNPRIDRRNLLQQTVSTVTRAVIDKDQLKSLANVLHYGLQAVVERGDILLFVMERNDDGIFRHSNMILPGPQEKRLKVKKWRS